MTEPKDRDSGTRARDRAPSGERAKGVIDPSWENVLVRGQEEAGEHGNLDADLAMLHLLRHAREPDAFSDHALEEIWTAVDDAVTPVPWWKRKWLLWAAPVAAAAAVMFIIVQPGDDTTLAQGSADASSNSEDAAEKVAVADPVLEESSRKQKRARSELAAVADEEAPAEAMAEGGEALPAPAAAATKEQAKPGRMGSAQALERQFAMLEVDARAALVASVDRERATLRHEMIGYAKRGGR